MGVQGGPRAPWGTWAPRGRYSLLGGISAAGPQTPKLNSPPITVVSPVWAPWGAQGGREGPWGEVFPHTHTHAHTHTHTVRAHTHTPGEYFCCGTSGSQAQLTSDHSIFSSTTTACHYRSNCHWHNSNSATGTATACQHHSSGNKHYSHGGQGEYARTSVTCP